MNAEIMKQQERTTTLTKHNLRFMTFNKIQRILPAWYYL